jgi:hypothetical protein
MPIYINERYPAGPDGKEWKHVEGCRVLDERAHQGFPTRKIQRNMDASKSSYREHRRRRCPVCMPDADWPDTEPHNPR